MIARGHNPAGIRLRLIALERLALLAVNELVRAPFNRLLKVTPRRHHRQSRWRDSGHLKAEGIALMVAAEAAEPNLSSAIAHRGGCQQAVLAMRPYRRDMFVRLNWVPAGQLPNRNEPYVTEEGGNLVIVCPQLKRRRSFDGKAGLRGGKHAPLRVTVAKDLVEWIRRYIEIYRPLLLGKRSDSGALWLSESGSRLSARQFYKDIVKQSRISPHTFRASRVTTAAIREPGGEMDANLELGNTRKVMFDHYIDYDPQVTIAMGRVANAMFDRVASGDCEAHDHGTVASNFVPETSDKPDVR